MSELAQKAQEHVKALFEQNLPKNIVFHNFDHVRRVHDQCQKLAKATGLSGSQIEQLEIAAWFHDAGYVEGRAESHELVSKNLAEDWLRQMGSSQSDVSAIGNLILATSMGHTPQNEIEQVLVDADLSHLGSDYYMELQDVLRKEMESIRQEQITDLDWCKMNVEFFEKHEYYSEAGKQAYNELKEDNLSELKKKIQELENGIEKPISQGKVKKKKKKKKTRPDRGIETMFRVALRNHVQLSRLADNKANIMLSINAIVISVVLTSLLPKLDTNPFLIWPTLILLGVCILSIIFATLSTIPSVTTGDANRDEIKKKNVNLIFFGNFHNMTLDDYDWGMRYMMEDSEYLYGSLIKDLYFLGKVLHKKYKYLRITYLVFMVGIIISVVAFVMALILV